MSESMRKIWDNIFMLKAVITAIGSPDPSTQVGAVLVQGNTILSTGFNAFRPEDGISSEKYKDRPFKLKHIRHAEVACVENFGGSLTSDMTLYTTHFPCSRCAGFILTSGVKTVVTNQPTGEFLSRWAKSIGDAGVLFAENGIILREL